MVMVSVIGMLLAAAGPPPVTVEIVASGHVETPADRFRVTGSALACAATQAEADALLAQKVAAIARSMAAIGVEKSVAQDKPSIAGMMGSIMGARGVGACNGADATFLDDAKAMDKPATPVAASTLLSFDARDRAAAARAIAALKAADAKPSDKVLPVLLNDTEARRAAKQMALRKARIEADAYAAPLGLKGATLTKISERQDWGSLDFVAQMVKTLGISDAAATDEVATDVTLTVEFELGR